MLGIQQSNYIALFKQVPKVHTTPLKFTGITSVSSMSVRSCSDMYSWTRQFLHAVLLLNEPYTIVWSTALCYR